jgi:hypothetical protein
MDGVIRLLELAEMLLRCEMAKLLDDGYRPEEAGRLMRAMSDVDSALVNLQGGAA